MEIFFFDPARFIFILLTIFAIWMMLVNIYIVRQNNRIQQLEENILNQNREGETNSSP